MSKEVLSVIANLIWIDKMGLHHIHPRLFNFRVDVSVVVIVEIMILSSL